MKNLEQFVIEAENPLDEIGRKKLRVDKKSKNRVKWAVDEPVDDGALRGYEDYTDSMEDLIDKFEVEEDFFILGRAGWGKTSTIENLAAKYDRKVVTVYLDKAEAVDLGGIPVPVQAKVKGKVKNALGEREEREFAKQMKALPDWASYMFEHPDTDFLLFFDEMNQAAPDVMNALMPIILKHEICGIEFDNFFVGAAGNFEDENEAVSELSAPLKSRLKPIITWEVNTEKAWKQVFKFLHRKWDKYITKDFVDKFEEAATCFDNPREIEMKIFQYAYRIKTTGDTERNDASRYLRRLHGLAKEGLSRTEQKQLETLADTIYAFIAGNDTEQKSRKRSKNGDMIPENAMEVLRSGMMKGMFSAAVIDKETGKEKNVLFGISEDTARKVINEDVCNEEMFERAINKLKADGLEWKYKTKSEWLGVKKTWKDPETYNFKLTKYTKIIPLSTRSKSND